MEKKQRVKQIRLVARDSKDAIVMMLSASADMGSADGCLISGAKFEEAAELIIAYFEIDEPPPAAGVNI